MVTRRKLLAACLLDRFQALHLVFLYFYLGPSRLAESPDSQRRHPHPTLIACSVHHDAPASSPASGSSAFPGGQSASGIGAHPGPRTMSGHLPLMSGPILLPILLPYFTSTLPPAAAI
ncbi:uncharacterized protein LOC120445716 [Drosophila santomea]|uniref:uncharacterized protein LOC120445716 n=1 Tax=Drosophila santomea TaxID=129105 RepID=UPI001954A3DD|nr:uncharacterized protein LOC120445716 [Drosophila santomea]